MIDIIGLIGSLCFGLCAVPQAYHTFKTKQADDLSPTFLQLWVAGEILCTVYSTAKLGLINPLNLNYLLNFLCLMVMCYYKFYYKK